MALKIYLILKQVSWRFIFLLWPVTGYGFHQRKCTNLCKVSLFKDGPSTTNTFGIWGNQYLHPERGFWDSPEHPWIVILAICVFFYILWWFDYVPFLLYVSLILESYAFSIFDGYFYIFNMYTYLCLKLIIPSHTRTSEYFVCSPPKVQHFTSIVFLYVFIGHYDCCWIG